MTIDRWLGGFAHRIELDVGLLLAGGCLALAVAWLTVAWQTTRAARADPVDVLRSE